MSNKISDKPEKNEGLFKLKCLLSIENQLLGAPESIQHIMEFFCAVVREPVCGIVPFETAVLIELLALNIAV